MRSDGHRPGEDVLGRVDYLAVEFPGGRVTASGFEQLMSLVRQGTIRVLDAVAGGDRLAQLTQLRDLKNAGVLTEAESEREKARTPNG